MSKLNHISNDKKTKTTIEIDDEYVTIARSTRLDATNAGTRWRCQEKILIDRAAWNALTDRARG